MNGQQIAATEKKPFAKTRQFFSDLAKGSILTKISCVFMGAGQIGRKQFVKGAVYFILECLFFYYLISFGLGYLAKFGTLGTVAAPEGVWSDELGHFIYPKGDNSFLILLYSVVTLIIIAAFIILWVMNVRGNILNDKLVAEGKKVSTIKEDLYSFINEKFHITLLIPPLLGLLVFTIMPLIFMILIAFTNYDYSNLPPDKLFTWVGFENFKELFTGFGVSGGSGFGVTFLRVLGWTLVWAFFATFSNYFLGMIVALMINKKGIRFKKFFRTMFVIAIAVPQFVTLLLMQKILDVDGILNVILGTNIRWLADTRWNSLIPRIVIIVVNMWIGIPYTLLMCSGVLMNIPADLSEAARIDGANSVQIFFKITLPYMLHVTGPHLITQFVGNINNFNIIWLLTGGGPIDILKYSDQAQSTDLLVTWLYRLTTDNPVRYNIASVIGIIIFVISAGLSLITYNRSSAAKNEEDYQ